MLAGVHVDTACNSTGDKETIESYEETTCIDVQVHLLAKFTKLDLYYI